MFGKPSKRGIWNTVVCMLYCPYVDFRLAQKQFGQKRPCFPCENRAILGQIVFVPGPAFSHFGETGGALSAVQLFGRLALLETHPLRY